MIDPALELSDGTAAAIANIVDYTIEHDVEPIDGVLMCGPCHVHVWESRQK